MNTSSFEKIINEAWNNKNKINSKSSKKILNAISKTIESLDSGDILLLKKRTMNGLLTNGLRKQSY